MQFGSVDRIERALALFMIVAWRIAYLMRMDRTCPDLHAALIFDPDEIHSAHLPLKKRRSSKPLGLNEMVSSPAKATANRAQRQYGKVWSAS